MNMVTCFNNTSYIKKRVINSFLQEKKSFCIHLFLDDSRIPKQMIFMKVKIWLISFLGILIEGCPQEKGTYIFSNEDFYEGEF